MYFVIDFGQKESPFGDEISLRDAGMVLEFNDRVDFLREKFGEIFDYKLRDKMSAGSVTVSDCNHVEIFFGDILFDKDAILVDFVGVTDIFALFGPEGVPVL